RYAVLRTHLVPGLLEAVGLNLRQGTRDLRLFEIGRVYGPKQEDRAETPDSKPDEEVEVEYAGLSETTQFAAVLTGARAVPFWNAKPEPSDFYDVTGVVLNLTQGLGLPDPVFDARPEPGFEPGEGAAVAIGPRTIGYCGAIAGALCERFGIDQKVYGLVFDWSALWAEVPEQHVFQELPRYPAVRRDYAFVLSEAVPAAELLAAARAIAGPTLEAIEVFDHYVGKNLPPGQHSIGLRLLFRVPDRTLTSEEIDELSQRLISGLQERLGAQVRDRAYEAARNRVSHGP
ncbi:MAG: hypothetical protein ABIK62_07660, partial [candidate division WOR-3 bacterium]